MATIDVSSAMRTKNDLLRTLLHKGKPIGLRLFEPTSNAIGGRQEILTLTSGWNHKQNKNPETGVVIETIKINVTDTMTQDVMNRAEGCDIVYDDNTFERFTFHGKGHQPSVIGKEWNLTVTPSLGDKSELHEPVP